MTLEAPELRAVPAPTAGRTVSEPSPAGVHGLDAVFRPRSVAVIGASRERGTVGGVLFHNLIVNGFTGPVYPVNPKTDSVQSSRAYPTIEAVPGPVDLAIVVVPAIQVAAAIEACGRKGVRGVVVVSAGFKEIAGQGETREQELLEIARRYKMRLVGPNCLGVLNTEAGVRLDATFAPTYPPAGPVAFSSQSGALGLAILEYAAQLNIGISHFISVGNKADVSGNDLLEYWEADPGTRVILLYLESFGNPRRFLEIARRVNRTKPILAVKSGRTGAGKRAAASHTGALAGADAAVDALCRQSGVVRTDTIEELFDVAMVVANQPIPKGNRVGIVTNAGGPGILASDACESHGLIVPALDPGTDQALHEFLPPEASTRNPVDMIASATPQAFERAVALMLEDPNLDAVLAIFVPPMITAPEAVAQSIARGTAAGIAALAARGLPPKPVLSCFMGMHGMARGLESLQSGHIPSFPFPESAAIALARATEYGAWLAQPDGREVRFADVQRDAARDAMAPALRRAQATVADGSGTSWLKPEEVAALLAAYGLRLPGSALARSAEETAAFATQLGFPVAIKLASDTITHKSDVGGVVLDVRSAEEARQAFESIVANLREHHLEREMAGVTVQRMLTTGIETAVGVARDPKFGPLVMFGLGGVQVELLKDVTFRVHPLTDRDARDMIRSLRGHLVFDGWRGAPAGDLAALEELLLRVSQMLEEHPEIEEMDLNPVKVLAPGQGCVVVDARVSVHAS